MLSADAALEAVARGAALVDGEPHQPADAEFGKEMGTRTWKIDTGKLSLFNGGNQ